MESSLEVKCTLDCFTNEHFALKTSRLMGGDAQGSRQANQQCSQDLLWCVKHLPSTSCSRMLRVSTRVTSLCHSVRD